MKRMSMSVMACTPPQPLLYIVPPCSLPAVMRLLDNDSKCLDCAKLVAGGPPARAFYTFAMLCHYKPGLRQLVSGEKWERFFASSALVVADHLAFRFTADEALHHFCALLLC